MSRAGGLSLSPVTPCVPVLCPPVPSLSHCHILCPCPVSPCPPVTSCVPCPVSPCPPVTPCVPCPVSPCPVPVPCHILCPLSSPVSIPMAVGDSHTEPLVFLCPIPAVSPSVPSCVSGVPCVPWGSWIPVPPTATDRSSQPWSPPRVSPCPCPSSHAPMALEWLWTPFPARPRSLRRRLRHG